MQYYSEFLDKYKKNNLAKNDFIVFNYSKEIFACVRPYYIVIPDTYQKSEIQEKQIDNSHYETKTTEVEKIICN